MRRRMSDRKEGDGRKEAEQVVKGPRPHIYKMLKDMGILLRLRQRNANANANKSSQGMDRDRRPSFMAWSARDVVDTARSNALAVAMGICMLLFMAVEYTLSMVPFSSQPFDVGFVLTQPLHDFLMPRPFLNNTLAALNTVFVLMQTAYILWTWLVEGRGRPTIATIFMFACRGALGYSTQLPLPSEFLGSGVDFPVGNVSFFLFYSGHVAAAVIASLDMKRMKRDRMALGFDVMNVAQAVRLLATRGHYTIDLAAGVGAGWLFDSLAAKYHGSKPNHNNLSFDCVLATDDKQPFFVVT